MEDSCVFCKIARGELPSDRVYESKNYIVFPDINPHAPIHLLIVPKRHFKDLSEIDHPSWDELRDVVLELKNQYNLNGFRIVNNFGESAAVHHFHVHFLGNINPEAKL